MLFKGHVVTQHDLNQFTDVSKKSIQRDIKTINTFFY
ncbi:HTH domain-containing protein [Staphylococcus aureus]|nr:HTH domain-containing protein [Staphylococcus aureus]